MKKTQPQIYLLVCFCLSVTSFLQAQAELPEASTENTTFVEKVKMSKQELSFDFKDNYKRFQVNISGPENLNLRKDVQASNVFAIPSAGLGQTQFKDGRYSVEIRPNFAGSEAEQKVLRYLTETGQFEQLKAEKELLGIPLEVHTYNWTFSILNGQFVLPKNEAYGLKLNTELPQDLNIPTRDLATLRLATEHPRPTFINLNLNENTTEISTDYLGINPRPMFIAQVIATDLVVQGSECVGFDCVNGESFGFDTQRLKENNLRIHFDDTSDDASFPSTDWRIVANDTGNGGTNYLAFEDATAGRQIFRVEANAPANALIVEDSGHIGIGTADPVVDAHVVGGNTPTLRLEQDGSSGFTSQTWDIASNEANFFIRDVTNGSKLSFRIRPGAPESSIDIANNGEVGIGDSSPDARLHVKGLGDDLNSDAFIAENSTSALLFKIRNDGKVAIGNVVPEQELHVVGNVAISGSILPVSDARLKKEVKSIDNALTTLQKLRATSYLFRTTEFAEMNLLPGTQYGFIAQELEQVLPNLVANSDNPDQEKNFKRVNYTGLIPFLVSGMQEQQTIIDAQQAEIDALKQKVNEIDALKAQVAALAQLVSNSNQATQEAVSTARKDK